jgi:hypothetical protein
MTSGEMYDRTANKAWERHGFLCRTSLRSNTKVDPVWPDRARPLMPSSRPSPHGKKVMADGSNPAPVLTMNFAP